MKYESKEKVINM